MRKINYLIVPILLLTACNTPKYTTKTTKILPSTKEAKECMSSCNKKYEKGKQEYVDKCRKKVKDCMVSTKQRVTSNFSLYEKRYEDDMTRYRRDLIVYKNDMILYRDKFEKYNDRKYEERERYEEAMDRYYDDKSKYKEKMDKYQEFQKEKRENDENKRACSRSSKNHSACDKAESYRQKYMFVSSFDYPKKPIYEPRRPKRPKGDNKPIKPSRPLMPLKPLLSDVIVTEQGGCYDSCSYLLENGCFSLCGGTTKYEKICIENCEDEKR